jgi:sodium transport system permease protein
MSLSNVKLIFFRELRDQMRDRRTMFMILVLPLLLYPLLGMSVFQIQQFLKDHASKVRIIGTAALPGKPALLSEGKIAPAWAGERDASLLQLELVGSSSKTPAELRDQAQRDIRLGLCDLVVYFPPDFAERLARFRRTQTAAAESEEVPRPLLYFNSASDKSKVALQRMQFVLSQWREDVGKENLAQSNLSVAAVRPFEPKETDVAEEVRRRAALWSRILPFVLMVWALTGAFYPAVDLCAGEKERGTLETLLSSPAARSEIVWGKLLTVMTFSMATSLLNLASMAGTGAFIITQLQKLEAAKSALEIGPPPLMALGWLAIALVPISALFSALSLAVAAFARSSKEGQYYLMPLLMISLPLMMIPMLPASELDLGAALIPLSGLMLLLRTLIEGQYVEALRYSIPVVAVTAACCLLAIRWAVDQFNNESVLFRESERFDLGLWFRHLVRDREDTPTVGEAVLCGVLLLVIRFFLSLVAPMPRTWNDLVMTTLVLQVAFIATPACLMAIILTRKPLATLLICRPRVAATAAAAAVLALLLHPAMLWLNEGIRQLYPLSPQALEQLKPFDDMLSSASLWQVILLVGLTPAICEELAFRGFILSGLRRTGHKWAAIVLASIFFGLAHGILQQSLAACTVGIVIGYLAVKTGSLLPCVLYHFVHNSLSVLLSRLTPEWLQSHVGLQLLLEPAAETGVAYRLPTVVAAALLAAGVLWWLKNLPYRRSAEEQLQEALDSQPSAIPARSAV